MTLSMFHLPVSKRALFANGREQGLVRDGWAADHGYLLHALFARLFGDLAPKPFDLQESDQPAYDQLSVLAYSGHPLKALEQRAAEHWPQDQPAVFWDHAASRTMPTLPAGLALGFRVRQCPAIRIGKQNPLFAPEAEVDPYVALVQPHLVAGPPADREKILAGLPSRETVYRDWLARQLHGAALQEARIASIQDAPHWRKGQPRERAARSLRYGKRPEKGQRALVSRREVIFEGTLQITDADAFNALLARGIGRQRSCGLGLLMLRSAGG